MIKLLDTHQHLVYRDVAGYSWAKDIPPLAEDNFTVEDYLNLTEGLWNRWHTIYGNRS
jgi:predicted TIM-barrel fold metal-dependent hydrolase